MVFSHRAAISAGSQNIASRTGRYSGNRLRRASQQKGYQRLYNDEEKRSSSTKWNRKLAPTVDATHRRRPTQRAITGRRWTPSSVDAAHRQRPTQSGSYCRRRNSRNGSRSPYHIRPHGDVEKSVSARYDRCRSRRYPPRQMAQPRERGFLQTRRRGAHLYACHCRSHGQGIG